MSSARRVLRSFYPVFAFASFFAKHDKCVSDLKLATHLVRFTYHAILERCLPKIRRSASQRELMPIHLTYIILLSYFCVAYENSEFCYYIFPHNFFDFLREDYSMCESYTIRKPQNVIYKKPVNTDLHISPFSHYRTS